MERRKAQTFGPMKERADPGRDGKGAERDRCIGEDRPGGNRRRRVNDQPSSGATIARATAAPNAASAMDVAPSRSRAVGTSRRVPSPASASADPAGDRIPRTDLERQQPRDHQGRGDATREDRPDPAPHPAGEEGGTARIAITYVR